jgi:hypothetical protein
MKRRIHLLASLVLAGSAGCKGCADQQGTPAAAEAEGERSAQTARAQLLSRMSARKLDRSKAYPKDAQGAVQCDRDADCFILQAERCTPASLRHLQTVEGYGLTQDVHARYRITGSEVGRCKLEREVLKLDARIAQVTADALRKRGKSEEEIKTVITEALEGLRRRNRPRIECFLTSDQVLEAALNLAEGRHNPVDWPTACRDLEGKAPEMGGAEVPPPAAKAEPAKKPEAPGTDVPVPKQP